MDKNCEYCGKLFHASRADKRYCSANCRKYANQGIIPVEAKEIEQTKATRLGLPPLDQVDRTRAFTDDEMKLVRQLPYEMWLAYMMRPMSADVMSYEERLKHYVSDNFPSVRYHSMSGGGQGSVNPPARRQQI